MAKYQNEESELHKKHRQRLKQRFHEAGLEHFDPHLVMELLLFFGIPYKDTNLTAHRLLNQFGSIANVMDAPIELLKQCPGVGDHTATLLKLIPELARIYMDNKQEIGESYDTPQKLQAYFAPKFIGRTVEVVFIAVLDEQLRVIGCKLLREGTFHEVEIPFHDVMRFVMQHNASNIAIAHNHPLSLEQPSRMDQVRTRQLIEALRNMDIALVDHIVVGKDYRTFSMQQAGMLFGVA